MLLKTNQLQWLQLDPITFTFAPSLTSLLPLAVPDGTVQPAAEAHPAPPKGGTSDAAADPKPRESLRSRLTKFLGNFQKQMLAHRAFAADRARCKAEGARLLWLMKRREQHRVDFAPASVWGYVSSKLTKRVALCFFNLLRASKTAPAALGQACANCVVAFGGGPGPEIVAAVLLRRFLAHGNLQSECAQSGRHFVVDYCVEWEPVVAQTAQVLGTNIQFELGDIRCSMDAAENCQWVERVGFGRDPILLFFCFVLWESRDWHALVGQIWSNCAEGSVLLFCDPKCTLSELSQVLLSLKEGDNCWWLDELTLLVIK